MESIATDRIRYLDTATAYDLWSEVYDTDGNFLQALDTIEMKELLPVMLSKIEGPKPWRIVDLGCGTGRNTSALLDLGDVEITALDLSPKMLAIAQKRLSEEMNRFSRRCALNMEVFDMLSASEIPNNTRDAHAVVSTLVVEHVPLHTFLSTASAMLRSGGLLLVTNMHSEMGHISQAGFVDPKTGQKIRPVSHVHESRALIEEAAEHGLELVGEIKERLVDQELAPRLGIRAGKWVGVKVWFGGIFKKTDE